MNGHLPAMFLLASMAIIRPCMAAPAGAEQELLASDYDLAYEVFVGNGELIDALHVAEQALTQDPNNLLWRRRLARVADWTQNPELAYQHWKYLYVQGERDAEVTSAIERLASYANDYLLLIDLWRASARNQPLSDERWREIAELYERAAIPLVGARQLEQDYRKRGKVLLGELAARLYRNAGSDSDAERLYLDLGKRKNAPASWLKRAAQIYLEQDDFPAAYQLLNQYSNQISEGDYEYWRLLGDVAWRLQEDATALEAYRRATASPKAQSLDYDRLTLLMSAGDPLGAAAQAERFYRRTGSTDWVVRALDLYIDAGQYNDAQRLINSLDTEALAVLETHPHFLISRSNIRGKIRNLDGAIDDLNRALSLAPSNTEAQLNALWLLASTSHRHQDLRELMARIGPLAQQDARYWLVFAAAYQSLGDQGMAARFYYLKLQRDPDDPLILLACADLMEQMNNPRMATLLRSRAWRVLKQMKQPLDPLSEPGMASTSLILNHLSGDAAATELRRIAAHLRNFQGSSSDLDILLLHWALDHDSLESARAWIVNRLTRLGRPTPVWAQLQLALASDDRPALRRLLVEHGDELSASSKYYAFRQLDEQGKALEAASAALMAQPNNEDIQARFSEETIDSAHGLRVGASHQRFESFEQKRATVVADLHLWDHLRLNLGYAMGDQTSRDIQAQPFVPQHEIHRFASVEWDSLNSRAEVAGHSHSELASFSGWRLELSQAVNQRLTLAVAIDIHAPANESVALELGGMEDRVSGTATYYPARNLHISIMPSTARYMTQFGSYLGLGGRVDWEVGYSMRNAYPNWNMRASGSHGRYKALGNPNDGSLRLFDPAVLSATPNKSNLFMPSDVDFYSICTGVGQDLVDQAVLRSWRPLADVCATTYSNGLGYTALFGVVGPVFGADRLSATINVGQGGIRPENDRALFLNLSYQYYK